MTGQETPGLLGHIDRILKWSALFVGGTALAFMTAFSTINVLVMRKALNDPVRGGEDLMTLALVVVVAIAIPFGARTGAHIEIELLEEHMSQPVARFSLAAMKLLAIALTAFLAWRLWVAGGQASRFGESSPTLMISFGPFYRALALSFSVYVLVLALEFGVLLGGGKIPKIDLLRGDGS
ncbi:TRAP transporter small permease [Martelella soudanensis]|uniref:TRAP transporter small permease n=1 Tax=unclassified Martelella TaxID=2629616 RepID=UPI0015DEF2C6|nr:MULTISPECIES: TRAP transporter small permease [unclassified Martelella]